MKIGILKTGDVNPALVEKHGEYPDMFVRLLGDVDPSLEFLVVDVDGGEALGEPGDADGWLVTGSRHAAYEDHDWIEPLSEFLRAAIAAKVPVVGVCFGHQILAQALGGRVAKSDRGWALGVQEYEPAEVPGWMQGIKGGWSAHALFQDQVAELPEGAIVVARSEFCPFAALIYGDPEAPNAISVQPHPEISADYMRDIIEVRIAGLAPAETINRALDTIGKPVDSRRWAEVMVDYFRRASGARAA